MTVSRVRWGGPATRAFGSTSAEGLTVLKKSFTHTHARCCTLTRSPPQQPYLPFLQSLLFILVITLTLSFILRHPPYSFSQPIIYLLPITHTLTYPHSFINSAVNHLSGSTQSSSVTAFTVTLTHSYACFTIANSFLPTFRQINTYTDKEAILKV